MPDSPVRSVLVAPMDATVSTIHVEPGDTVDAQHMVVVLEVMKMEHPLALDVPGTITAVEVSAGEAVTAGQPLLRFVETDGPTTSTTGGNDRTVAARTRADLDLLQAARARLADDARPGAVAKVHRRGRLTARENVAALVDPDSFHEYGGLAFAAQANRRDRDELAAATPADGLITGIGRVNSDVVGADRAACAVAAYDYSVLAGTQGWRNHHKKDRLFELVARLGIPIVLFAEGGGGRPGDTDVPVISGLDTRAFEYFARLSGQVPTVGIASGRCFAGNAALLGCCDVIIATPDATIGMAGPAMIEGGGLGVFEPSDIGPIDVQVANGVVDVAASDDRAAIEIAKRYLAYFQGTITSWEAPDQHRLRNLIPQNRKSVYDIRAVIDGLADTGSTLELRAGFGAGIITTLARLQGRPIGILANDPAHLGGAIDRDGADKGARFLQLCEAHGLAVLTLCDTPGFMVGPEAERQAQVRHFARLFVTAAALTVPFGTVVLRKGYGLGAQAMAGGSFRAGLFTLSWPTGEFGGMGLEGAVRLGFRRELKAIEDDAERAAAYAAMVEAAYVRGRAVNVAAHLELDDVIDPAETRARVIDLFAAAPPRVDRPSRRFVDTW